MTETPGSETPFIENLLAELQVRGAAQHDPVGWHYIQALAARSHASTGGAHVLLHDKLRQVLDKFTKQMQAAPHTATATGTQSRPSPLAALLQDIAQHSPNNPPDKPANWRAESPHIQQFRHQLGKIQVQKQVSLAIAQAPQNAGPINSHMLVLRSLGLMRDISPDYLNRFMGYIDAMLSLDEAGQAKAVPKKTAAGKTEK
jgi:Protein of unknown function (DUF2894)